MARNSGSQRISRSRFSFTSMISLALWRLRQTGFLMCITTLGMIAAIIIVCAVPLFASVMNTAGLRSMLTAQAGNAEIEADTSVAGLSTAISREVRQGFDTMVRDNMRSVAGSMPSTQFSVISLDYDFVTSPPKQQRSLLVFGAEMSQAASRLGKLHGKLPAVASTLDTIEVLISSDAAKILQLKVGDEVPLVFQYYKQLPSFRRGDAEHGQQMLKARVSGIFDGDVKQSDYWHDIDFKPLVTSDDKGNQTVTATMLVPNESLLYFADAMATANKSDALYSLGSGFTLRWYYHLDLQRISSDDLDTLIGQIGRLQDAYTAFYGDTDGGASSFGPLSYPYLTRTLLTSPMFSSTDNPGNLELFRDRVAVSRIPVAVLAIQIILLILFFVSLMTNLLVDRQTDAIAVLRSRGASGMQIFSALLMQCVALGLLAFLIGVPLSLGAVILLTRRILTGETQNALNVITDHIPQVALTSALYGLGILLVVLLTMSISLLFAARMDVLAIRRQAARTNRRPLWQRLNLDVIAGVLALVSYGVSLYLTGVSNVLEGDARTLVVAPLSVVAPFFLILGCMLLFLRLFPLLVRLAASLVARGRGAVSMLALAQIARSPRQPIRMTMLLALATAFALFTLIYTASETYHIQQITTYMVGSDFGGSLPSANGQQDVAKVANTYRNIQGVLAASSGYTTKAVGGRGGIPIEFRAVDAATFVNTVNWPSQAEKSKGDELLKKLVSQRQMASNGPVVPAVVDTKTASSLLLNVGSTFTITIEDLNLQQLQYSIVGIVPAIPTVNNRITTGKKGTPVPGGVLVDYQTFRAIYTHQAQKAKDTDHKDDPFFTVDPPALNHVWLHTREDATSLASVRTALKRAGTRLNDVADRWVILDELTSDPLYLVLGGVLSIGTVTALLLALVGDLLASWLSARTRLTNFAVLRAIGSTPGEVTGVLTWEQVIIYVTGIVLGIGFGSLLATSIIPTLTFTDLNTNVNAAQFYTLQTAFPIQVVVPPTLLFGLLALAVLFILALVTMVRVVSQPAVAQTLRLNED